MHSGKENTNAFSADSDSPDQCAVETLLKFNWKRSFHVRRGVGDSVLEAKYHQGQPALDRLFFCNKYHANCLFPGLYVKSLYGMDCSLEPKIRWETLGALHGKLLEEAKPLDMEEHGKDMRLSFFSLPKHDVMGRDYKVFESFTNHLPLFIQPLCFTELGGPQNFSNISYL